jgi:hypothetical protein
LTGKMQNLPRTLESQSYSTTGYNHQKMQIT